MSRLALIVFALLVTAGSVFAAGGKSYKEISAVSKMRGSVDAGIRFYVKDPKGANDLKADSLEAAGKELATESPNWILIIAGNQRNEKFSGTDDKGRPVNLTGFKAMEWAAGTDIFYHPALQAKDARTGEKKTSVFMVAFNPNFMGYYASPLLDLYGLDDEKNWQGNLDQYFLRAYRQGKNPINGALAAIKEIERRLALNIKAEEDKVKAAATALATLEARLTGFRKDHPKVTGDLAKPDLETLRSKVASAQKAVQSGDIFTSRRDARWVTLKCRGLTAALSTYPEAEKQLATLATRLKKLKGNKYAPKAKEGIRRAEGLIDTASGAWERADSSYIGELKAATNSVNTVEKTILAARRNAVILWTSLIITVLIVLGVLGLVAVFAYIKSRPNKEEAEKQDGIWDEMLADKLKLTLKFDKRTADALGNHEGEISFTGLTGTLAKQVMRDVEKLGSLHDGLKYIHERAKALINPEGWFGKARNLFSSANYLEAIKLLRDQPVDLTGDDLRAAIEGKRVSEKERIYAGRKHYQPIRGSIDQLIKQFNDCAQRATESLDRIEEADANATTAIRNADQTVDELEASVDQVETLGEKDQALRVPAFDGKLVPAWEKVIKRAQRESTLDPVKALATVRTIEDSIATAKETVTSLKLALDEKWPLLKKAAAVLTKSDLEADWINEELAGLFKGADDYFTALTTGIVKSESVEPFSAADGLETLVARTAKAIELNTKRVNGAIPARAEVRKNLTRSTTHVAGKLKLDRKQVLVEKDRNPNTMLAKADALLTAISVALSDGNLEQAETLLAQVKKLLLNADGIINVTVKCVDGYDARVAAIKKKGAQLAGTVSQHQEVLARITEQYHPDVLRLGAGDATHPRANGTVLDNIDEVESARKTRTGLLSNASAQYKTGKVIASADLLARAETANEFIGDRLCEIREKANRLKASVAANTKAIATLKKAESKLAAQMDDPRVMQRSIAMLDQLQQQFRLAQSGHEADKPNPFDVEERLQKVDMGFKALDHQISQDREIFAEAKRSVSDARTQIQGLSKALRSAQRDDVPDSPEIIEAGRLFQRLFSELDDLDKIVQNKAHADWNAVDEQADRIYEQAMHNRAKVRSEEQEGKEAQSAISSAARKVREARNWTGRHGASIYGSPGSGALKTARERLARGDYDGAKEYARRAKRKASSAISDAEAEDDRLRREEDRRRRAAAAARRRRNARTSSYSSSSSYGSSSFSGFSGGSSGGSFSSFSGGSSGGSFSSF